MIEKIFFVAVVIYLLVAIPLYLMNSVSFKECEEMCLRKGYNFVVRAYLEDSQIKCWCRSSFTKQIKIIPLETNEKRD